MVASAELFPVAFAGVPITTSFPPSGGFRCHILVRHVAHEVPFIDDIQLHLLTGDILFWHCPHMLLPFWNNGLPCGVVPFWGHLSCCSFLGQAIALWARGAFCGSLANEAGYRMPR